jgi:Fe-S-cluster containining protein
MRPTSCRKQLGETCASCKFCCPRNRVALHLPDDLEMRFAKYSKRKLLVKRNNQAMLATLRKSEVPEICRVVELIDRHNAGLEQEALLI